MQVERIPVRKTKRRESMLLRRYQKKHDSERRFVLPYLPVELEADPPFLKYLF
jgi:hypothetical protein